jgi:DNA polymerase-3 subunit gamma/tau
MMAAGRGEPSAPIPPQPQTAPPVAAPDDVPEARRAAQPTTLLDISELADAHDEPLLAALIRTHVRLVRMQSGLLEISLTDGAPETLPGDMARQLTRWTETRWMVSLSDGAGSRTISEERQAVRQKQRDELAETPVIKSIFETFPGAEIESVRPAGHQDEEPSR